MGQAHTVVGGECAEHRPEHLARPEATVQQHQRTTVAVGLVVEVDPVDLDVLTLAVVLADPFGHGPAPRSVVVPVPGQTPAGTESHLWIGTFGFEARFARASTSDEGSASGGRSQEE